MRYLFILAGFALLALGVSVFVFDPLRDALFGFAGIIGGPLLLLIGLNMGRHPRGKHTRRR